MKRRPERRTHWGDIMDDQSQKQMRAAFGWTGVLRAAQQSRLQRTHFVAIGFGSLARPMAERLVTLGALDFSLVDPKRYSARSIATQCTADEVGQLKVDVGRQRLAAHGARVLAYPVDVATVPHGAVHRNSIVVASVDNPHADIGANRLAAQMGALLLKLNVEPAYGIAAVRAYDFRRATALCVECQFSAEQHYARQRHPRSCDGAPQQPSNTPRPLARLAAELGVLAATDCLDESRSGTWLGHEVQFSRDYGVTRSRLDVNPQCRWDHARRWQPLQRLASGPETISLAELVRLAEVVVQGATTARFCHDVALRTRCESCGHESAKPRWISDLSLPATVCPICAGHVLAIPFFVHGALPLESVAEAMTVPLADWGVPAGAVIELSGGGGRQAFVIGSDRRSQLRVGTLAAVEEVVG